MKKDSFGKSIDSLTLFPDDKDLASSKLKAFADEKLDITPNANFVFVG